MIKNSLIDKPGKNHDEQSVFNKSDLFKALDFSEDSHMPSPQKQEPFNEIEIVHIELQ